MKILVIGDQHFKENLSYADYISDRRVAEKKEVLDFIVKNAKGCDHVVFMGDNFNSKNNSSETNKEFIEFVERFNNKEVYIMSGNHEKKGNGKTAIDFMGETIKLNWHIFTKPSSFGIGEYKVDFLPYMLNSELGVETYDEATKKIVKNLDGGDILFAHHAITGTEWGGIKTEMFNEVVLPREKLEKKYQLVVAGHIHDPQVKGRTIITGSVFTDTVGEKEKFIWKINPEDGLYEKIKLPCREIHKLENPTSDQLSEVPIHSIVKVIITDESIDVEKLKKENLVMFDASLVIEQYPNERKKMHLENGAFDFSIEALLKLYSEEKGIDYQRLLNGLQLIK